MGYIFQDTDDYVFRDTDDYVWADVMTTYEVSVSETLSTNDTLSLISVQVINDPIVVADTVTPELIVLINDYMLIRGFVSAQQNGTVTIQDTVHIYDPQVEWLKIIEATITEALEIGDTPTAVMILLVADYMAARETLSNNLAGTKAISETIAATDAVVAEWVLSIAESIVALDTLVLERTILISEYFAVRDVLTGSAVSIKSISDALTISDNLVAEWVLSIAETVGTSDLSTPELTVLVADYFLIRETLTGGAVSSQTISDAIAITDLVTTEWVLGLIESLSVADILAFVRELSVSESVTISDVLSGLGAYGVTVRESTGISDYAQTIISLLVSESLIATDSAVYFRDIYLALSETLGATDALTASLNVYLALSENIVVVDRSSNIGVFGAIIQEGLAIDVKVTLDNEAYECWVLNTPKFYPSAYSGFNFNSYCTFRGRSFGANETGIFELAGDTDNGTSFHTGVLLHETDFGMRNQKRFRKAYLGVEGAQPIMAMETEDGQRIVYNVDDKGIVDASREGKSRDWRLSVSDFDELTSVKLIPVILARGI